MRHWYRPTPIRIVVFNTSEGWFRDVTMDISKEANRR
jgi:hypothetical protein